MKLIFWLVLINKKAESLQAPDQIKPVFKRSTRFGLSISYTVSYCQIPIPPLFILSGFNLELIQPKYQASALQETKYGKEKRPF